MDLLQVNGVSKKDERGFHLTNISFRQSERCNIAVAGETGSGKTTLLKIIAGLAQPDRGEVIFRDQKVIGPADKLIPGHQGIAYLSQDFRLPHFLRVEQILEYANEWPVEKADRLYSLCRIRHLFKRRTDELSGGEQQRIAIARLLIMDPKLFLLDEPFSNMDPANKELLKHIIEDIGNELNMSFIMISHDPVDTLPWAHEIIVMKDGQIVEKNSPGLIYSKPVSTYTAALFGKYNLLPEESLHLAGMDLKVPPGLRAIVRPEKCLVVDSLVTGDSIAARQIGQTGQSQIRFTGRAIAARHFGHYFETDFLVGEHKITSRSWHSSTQPGKEVVIQISGQDVHLVSLA
ncbi:ABC transporter ATP-binding protein [Flavitalea antarctica]